MYKKILKRNNIREELLKQGTLNIKGKEYVLPVQPKPAPAGGNGFILFARTATTPAKDVAIKVFLPSPKWQNAPSRGRFLQEIEILIALNHQNVVRCLGNDDLTTAENDRLPCYVMPRAQGSMRDRMDAGAFRDEAFCRDFFLSLAEALQAVHEKNVYHRDLKPENVLNGERDMPLLADFGIAHVDPGFVKKLVETRAADQLHNMHYYAPEQRKGQDATKVDHRADIWAFGYLLLEALTGRYPMGPNAFLPSQVNSEWLVFDYIVLKCTEIEANRRYQSMADCYNDLSAAFRGHRSERDALASFFSSSRRVEFMAQLKQHSAELLSAATLRALYLNRSHWEPRGAGKDVIFANLLMRGGGGYRKQRLLNPDTPESEAAPGSLGWYWFSNISYRECMALLRHSLRHSNVNVRAGAVRALGYFGTKDDAVQLTRLLYNYNPIAVTEALRSLANLKLLEYVLILTFINDQRDAVRQACAEVLGSGIVDDADAAKLLNGLLDDNNPDVRREAARSIAKLDLSDPGILEKLDTLAKSDKEDRQVKSFANVAAKVLRREAELPCEDSHVRQVTKKLSRHGLGLPYSAERERTAWDLLQRLGGAPYTWDAATLWIATYQPRESAERQLEALAPSLHFRALQALDFRMYSPKWWQKKMDPVGDLVR